MSRRWTSLQPETLAMAVQWEETKKRYLRAGLCHNCAAQAAWAHQPGAGGFGATKPPCPDCAELVTLFAYPTINPAWRAVLRKRR